MAVMNDDDRIAIVALFSLGAILGVVGIWGQDGVVLGVAVLALMLTTIGLVNAAVRALGARLSASAGRARELNPADGGSATAASSSDTLHRPGRSDTAAVPD